VSADLASSDRSAVKRPPSRATSVAGVGWGLSYALARCARFRCRVMRPTKPTLGGVFGGFRGREAGCLCQWRRLAQAGVQLVRYRYAQPNPLTGPLRCTSSVMKGS
jgi:hypothetical protein